MNDFERYLEWANPTNDDEAWEIADRLLDEKRDREAEDTMFKVLHGGPKCGADETLPREGE